MRSSLIFTIILTIFCTYTFAQETGKTYKMPEDYLGTSWILRAYSDSATFISKQLHLYRSIPSELSKRKQQYIVKFKSPTEIEVYIYDSESEIIQHTMNFRYELINKNEWKQILRVYTNQNKKGYSNYRIQYREKCRRILLMK